MTLAWPHPELSERAVGPTFCCPVYLEARKEARVRLKNAIENAITWDFPYPGRHLHGLWWSSDAVVAVPEGS